MNALSEMYPVFESPFPTLLTHTDNGLGIFVAHPKVPMNIKQIGADDNIFRVVTGDLNFFFPLKVHAQDLLKSQGGVLAFTDENGMPWYTLEMSAMRPPVSKPEEKTQVHIPMPRNKFGRPRVSARSVSMNAGEEGDFSL